MNHPHLLRFALLTVICAFGPMACTTTRTVDVREEVDGLTVSVHYRKPQAVRNYPVAVMEAIRILAATASAEAGKRGREVGAVRVTGGSMDYALVPAKVHVEMTGRVTWGTGWTGAVDDPTKLQEEAKLKQQGLRDFMGALGAVKQAPPMQTVNVYVQPQPAPPQPQSQAQPVQGHANPPKPEDQKNVVVP